jgi:Tfp pilus assembly protein PilX
VKDSLRLSRDEKGVALAISLLVLLVLTVLGIMMMTSANLDRRAVGYNVRGAQALNVAEAGVSEAMSRIRNDDVNMSAANPRSVAQIFACQQGSVPTLGTDSTGLATSQPIGNWLDYSTASRSDRALTVKFKTNSAGTAVMRYDPSLSDPVNTSTGYPIYVITSTGMQGTGRRSIQVEVIQKPFNALARAALAANQDIRFIGTAAVCGYNHSASTHENDGDNGRGTMPGDLSHCIDDETGSGNLPGSWTTGATTNGGSATQAGTPANVSNQTGFYSGPWDALGMTQANFLSWIGAPVSTAPANLNGIYYIDGDAVVGNQSTNIGIHGGDGEGMLYVDGDLTANATFSYRGLLYVEGDLNLNGTAWILGGVIVKGRSQVRHNGGATILYSSDAISQALARYGGQFVTLSWRELP